MEENNESKHEHKAHHEKHSAHHNHEAHKTLKIDIWRVMTYTLAVLFIISLYFNISSWRGDGTGDDSSDNATIASGEQSIIVLNDKRCSDCATRATQIIGQLKGVFPGVKITEVDYNDKDGKELYKSSASTTLPAILFTKDITTNAAYTQIQQYVTPAGEYLSLRVGSTFDPSKEICGNGIDDTGDGKADCEDATCKGVWDCVEKSDKPVVEAFVMSHCPFGTQIEKGLLPVAKLLGDKIDFNIKFVNYAMHGQKEIDEQLNQYCINQEYADKYLDYLECFLGTTSGSADEGKQCMKDEGIDAEKISSCVKATDSKFGISTDYADKSKWKGSYPPFNIFEAENIKYGVRGSPSLRINGAEPSAGRDAKSLLDAICFAFKNKPTECSQSVSSEQPSSGFGWATTAAAPSTAECG